MERKRKLPARAAARVEQVAKKRTATPPENRSATPALAPATPVVEEPPPPPPVQPLPRSIQPGKPLPIVDEPQPDDLPNNEYQTVLESGVAGESLHRSRQRWISEVIFEKYWTKPTKRKGVVIEEPNNPPKDSMSKLGVVTVIVEPHIFEATMYGVKDPKPPPPPPASVRPVLQYGPPNGIMPPPPLPTSISTPSTPVATPTDNALTNPAPPSRPPSQPQAPQRPSSATPTQQAFDPPAAVPGAQNRPQTTPPPPAAAAPTQPPAAAPPSFPSRPPPPPSATPGAVNQNGAPSPAASGEATPPAAGTDPIIVLLAERASNDPHLRDLMKRVAGSNASPAELAHFQTIIDDLTAETKRKGSAQGPSADRLLVGGKTVRYFADEVRAILDIVLASNPLQTSASLRPPDGSDPLVVLLVKAALDDSKTREIVRRIAKNRPQFSDAQDLKAILDKLSPLAAKELEMQRKASGQGSVAPSPNPGSTAKTNGAVSNGMSQSATQHQVQPAAQPALRSKGPPPAPKPDYSAAVFEFAGGTGDRYLFPKFSILEFIPNPAGTNQQLLASFIVVRKGSTTEYGGDPDQDYWQPVTIRLQSTSQRLLESLTRIVASPEEVRRYMNDVMDNMTRAEYVLLAMRLPRSNPGGDDGKEAGEDANWLGSGPSASKTHDVEMTTQAPPPHHEGVLWTAKAAGSSSAVAPAGSVRPANRNAPPVSEDEQYQKFISSVTPSKADDA